jgi:hypothetical protein
MRRAIPGRRVTCPFPQLRPPITTASDAAHRADDIAWRIADLTATARTAGRWVITWNASSNEPMLAINSRLGFRTAAVWTTWQADADAIRESGQPKAGSPTAPRTARAIDLAIGGRCEGPVFLAGDGRRLDRHGAAAAAVARSMPAAAPAETGALYPRGDAATSLPQAPSVRLPSLGRIDRFADRRWPGLAPDDHRPKKR